MTFPVSEEEHRKFFTLKYTFIRQGNITVSNSEIMSKLLEEYIAAHKDEIVEIPDAVYKNYVEKRLCYPAGLKDCIKILKNIDDIGT